MPFLELDSGRTHYRFDGPDGAPVVMFSNSLGTNLAMWEPQVVALARRFRILRYDTRGHGLSSVPRGPHSIEQLGRDVIQLLDRLEIEKICFCGLSMGGMIGMWLGANATGRVNKLVLCNTSPRIGTAEMCNARIETVLGQGMASVADTVIQGWFTKGLLASMPEQVEWTRQMLLQSPPDGYAASCAAIRDMDQGESITQIKIPTLVIAGRQDPVTPPADAKFPVERVTGARYAEVDAAHLSNFEAAPPFTNTLLKFLSVGETN